MALPPDLSAAEFDALHDEPAAWRADIEALARSLGSATLEPVEEGTALVSRVEGGRILKVYPPFLHDHYAFERVMLDRLHGRLALPTPQRLADGLYQGWPWVLMSELPGTPLSAAWPGLGQAQRRAALRDLGALAAQVHALPVGEMAALAPAWPDFIAVQRDRCAQRQRRVKLPPHLLAHRRTAEHLLGLSEGGGMVGQCVTSTGPMPWLRRRQANPMCCGSCPM